jgi:hypothetical protein
LAVQAASCAGVTPGLSLKRTVGGGVLVSNAMIEQ